MSVPTTPVVVLWMEVARTGLRRYSFDSPRSHGNSQRREKELIKSLLKYFNYLENLIRVTIRLDSTLSLSHIATRTEIQNRRWVCVATFVLIQRLAINHS